ncbi:MAG: tRNA epoxyqueuosine(34) reductase QueG [Acidobacteriota bacterium]|jgi:epoxyqueuosine reductase
MSERHGFDLCAVTPIAQLEAAQRLREWLAHRMHGTMGWLERNADKRCDPHAVLPGARSVVVVAMNYHTEVPATHAADEGCISRYAWGDEYHDILGCRLSALQADLEERFPGMQGRWYVDTGPVLEKAWGEQAGIGWIGKHTNVINRELGSWIFLGALIVDLDLAGGAPHGDYCGSCTACIDVCPTDAIVAPYVLDARRCISYLTIENRGQIPAEFRVPIGNRVFGCDDCQDVCPWNRFAHESAQARLFYPAADNAAPKLIALLALDEPGFRARFRDSPVLRAKHRGFLRNVAVALGNSGDDAAVPALIARLDHAEELVRGHVAWALGRLGGEDARIALRGRLAQEEDAWVRDEISAALDAAGAVA